MKAASQLESPTGESFRAQFQDSWRWTTFIAIYFLGGISGLYIPPWFDIPMSNPGANPPWYFIRQDFFTGVGMLFGAIVMLSITAITRRRYPSTNLILCAFIGIWMIPAIITSMIIFARCTNFFDYPNAISPWPTHDDYLKSGTKFAGIPIAFIIAFLFLLPQIRQVLARRSQSRRDASQDNG